MARLMRELGIEGVTRRRFKGTTKRDASARAAPDLVNRDFSAGDAPVMPTPKDPFACMSRSLARDWWKKTERFAGLDRKRGRGWHSLRRKFASDLMDVPLKVLCDLGGWKTAQTVLQCYQRPDEDRLRKGTRGVPGSRFRVQLAGTFAAIASPKSRKSNGPG